MRTPFHEVRRLRRAGVVHAGTTRATTLREVAVAFGLKPDEATYQAIDRSEARTLVIRVLHQNLAYSSTLMRLPDAEALADRVLAEFPPDETRYFTNGTWHAWRRDGRWTASWNPATEATFDTGVLFVGAARSGVIWVEDED